MTRQVTESDRATQKIVPGQRVRMSGETARVGARGQENHGEPRVELVRDGDIVRAIDVTCSCGRHVRLNCVY